jgi:rhodanese-related sulfurtransferase
MKNHILNIVVGIFVGALLLAMVGKKFIASSYPLSVSKQAKLLTSKDATFSLYDLALATKSNDPYVMLIDIRPEVEFAKGHLPNAINIPADRLLSKEFSEYIPGRKVVTKVLYGNTEAQAVKANAILIMNGISICKTLNGGYEMAKNQVISNPAPSYYHISDEKQKFNYSWHMPAGASTKQSTATDEVKVEVTTPRGGC